MDVAISTLRAELSSCIDRVRGGEEIVVTDRGTPVARLLPVDAAPLLDQLVKRGVLSKPRRAAPLVPSPGMSAGCGRRARWPTW